VLEETVGVVPLDAGKAMKLEAAAGVMLEVVSESVGVLAITTTGLETCVDATTVFTTLPVAEVAGRRILVAAAAAVVAVVVGVVVGGWAAASVATLPMSVVAALGTAVHRWPLIEVMKNPAGRVDMTRRKKGDTSRDGEGA
jgi:hypothetical protein